MYTQDMGVECVHTNIAYQEYSIYDLILKAIKNYFVSSDSWILDFKLWKTRRKGSIIDYYIGLYRVKTNLHLPGYCFWFVE